MLLPVTFPHLPPSLSLPISFSPRLRITPLPRPVALFFPLATVTFIFSPRHSNLDTLLSTLVP